MGDENQIGPNINATPVQRYGSDGPYPSGKTVSLQLWHPGFKPHCRRFAGMQAGPGTSWENFSFCLFFFFFFCFDCVPIVLMPYLSGHVCAMQALREAHLNAMQALCRSHLCAMQAPRDPLLCAMHALCDLQRCAIQALCEVYLCVL